MKKKNENENEKNNDVHTNYWDDKIEKKVLLKIAYVGTNYAGLAIQRNNNTIKTIEGEIIKSLIKTKFIISYETSGISRCGRTDKGVSASGNYLSLRIKLHKDFDSDATFLEKQFNIVKKLNSVLPPDIRIIQAKPVKMHFDARLNCLYRIYKYIFLPLNLNIKKMKEAAKCFVGKLNFQNFCKIDKSKKNSFVRCIFKFEIDFMDDFTGVATIYGNSFLWHQVRCMMGILFNIGKGKADISDINYLLMNDTKIDQTMYNMAAAEGLILYDCIFEEINFDENKNDKIFDPLETFRKMYLNQLLKVSIMRCLTHSEPFDSSSSISLFSSHSSSFFSSHPSSLSSLHPSSLSSSFSSSWFSVSSDSCCTSFNSSPSCTSSSSSVSSTFSTSSTSINTACSYT